MRSTPNVFIANCHSRAYDMIRRQGGNLIQASVTVLQLYVRVMRYQTKSDMTNYTI